MAEKFHHQQVISMAVSNIQDMQASLPDRPACRQFVAAYSKPILLRTWTEGQASCVKRQLDGGQSCWHPAVSSVRGPRKASKCLSGTPS